MNPDYIVGILMFCGVLIFCIGCIVLIYQCLIKSDAGQISEVGLLSLALKHNLLIGNGRVWTQSDQMRGVMYGAPGGGVKATREAIYLAISRENKNESTQMGA